jgi:hypothetical protein
MPQARYDVAMRRCLTDLGYGLAAILLIAGLYESAYYLAVERDWRSDPPGVRTVVGKGLAILSFSYYNGSVKGQVVPKYRVADATLQPFFHPAHEIDRRLRPDFWTSDRFFADWLKGLHLVPLNHETPAAS